MSSFEYSTHQTTTAAMNHHSDAFCRMYAEFDATNTEFLQDSEIYPIIHETAFVIFNGGRLENRTRNQWWIMHQAVASLRLVMTVQYSDELVEKFLTNIHNAVGLDTKPWFTSATQFHIFVHEHPDFACIDIGKKCRKVIRAQDRLMGKHTVTCDDSYTAMILADTLMNTPYGTLITTNENATVKFGNHHLQQLVWFHINLEIPVEHFDHQDNTDVETETEPEPVVVQSKPKSSEKVEFQLPSLEDIQHAFIAAVADNETEMEFTDASELVTYVKQPPAKNVTLCTYANSMLAQATPVYNQQKDQRPDDRFMTEYVCLTKSASKYATERYTLQLIRALTALLTANHVDMDNIEKSNPIALSVTRDAFMSNQELVECAKLVIGVSASALFSKALDELLPDMEWSLTFLSLKQNKPKSNKQRNSFIPPADIMTHVPTVDHVLERMHVAIDTESEQLEFESHYAEYVHLMTQYENDRPVNVPYVSTYTSVLRVLKDEPTTTAEMKNELNWLLTNQSSTEEKKAMHTSLQLIRLCALLLRNAKSWLVLDTNHIYTKNELVSMILESCPSAARSAANVEEVVTRAFPNQSEIKLGFVKHVVGKKHALLHESHPVKRMRTPLVSEHAVEL